MAQLVKTPAASAPRHLPVLQAVEPDMVPHKDDRAAGHVDAVTQRACSQSMDSVWQEFLMLLHSNVAWQHARQNETRLWQLACFTGFFEL